MKPQSLNKFSKASFPDPMSATLDTMGGTVHWPDKPLSKGPKTHRHGKSKKRQQ